MLKKIYSIIFIGCIYVYAYAQEQFNLDTARQVQKRFYTIRRLEDSVATFKKVHQHISAYKHHAKSPEIRYLNANLHESLKHPAIKKVVREIMATHSLEPFYGLWTDFLAYKHIDDTLYSRELITLLLMLYKTILMNAMTEATEHEGYINEMLTKTNERESLKVEKHASELTPHVTTDLITILSSNHHGALDFCHDIKCDVKESLDNITSLYGPQENSAHDFMVHNSMRFYHIQRLICSVFTLSRRGYTFSLAYPIHHYFEHPCIQQGALEIYSSQSLVPLFKIWKNFVSYDFIEDAHFVRDFIRLLIIVYSYLLQEHLITTTTITKDLRPTISMGGDVFYEKIAELPIQDLLMMLDEVADQFALMSQHYELMNQKISWTSWFQRYWWTPPIIIGSIIVTVARYATVIKNVIAIFQKKALPSSDS